MCVCVVSLRYKNQPSYDVICANENAFNSMLTRKVCGIIVVLALTCAALSIFF